MRRELRKLAESPDASHQTHPERQVLTGLMRREGHQNARIPDAEHRTYFGVSGALCFLWSDSTVHQTLKASVWCLPAVRPVSVS